MLRREQAYLFLLELLQDCFSNSQPTKRIKEDAFVQAMKRVLKKV
jgi:hypothetical protein